jgi:hypothetical protein
MIRAFPVRFASAGLLAAFSLTSLTGCETATGQGAAIGATSGAVIGGIASNSVRGAALGTAAGAAAGALIGAAIDADRADSYGHRPRSGYPVAQRTDRYGYVISPYSPYYEIDVRGIPHGALVRDPSCDRLFVRP